MILVVVGREDEQYNRIREERNIDLSNSKSSKAACFNWLVGRMTDWLLDRASNEGDEIEFI